MAICKTTRCCYWCRTKMPMADMVLIEEKRYSRWSCGNCPKRKGRKTFQGHEMLGQYRVLARRSCVQ